MEIEVKRGKSKRAKEEEALALGDLNQQPNPVATHKVAITVQKTAQRHST